MNIEVPALLWKWLRDSVRLQNLSGGAVRIYQGMAKPNPVMPYLTFVFREEGSPDEDEENLSGQILIDIWDSDEDAERIKTVARAVKARMKRFQQFCDRFGDPLNLWVHYKGARFIPTGTDKVYRVGMQWRCGFSEAPDEPEGDEDLGLVGLWPNLGG